MADPDAIARKRFDEYIDKLNTLANKAASAIIENRDKAKSDLLAAKNEACASVEKLEKALSRYDRQKIDLSALADKAAVLQERMERIEESLGWDEDCANELLGLVGKVVCIKSSPGTRMTAAAVGNDGRILCAWMDGGGYMEAPIPFAALEVVKQEGIQESVEYDDPVLSTPVNFLAVMCRAGTALREEGINYIGDLIQLSEKELAEIHGIGSKAIRQIKESLAERGLKLGMRLENFVVRSAAEGGAK